MISFNYGIGMVPPPGKSGLLLKADYDFKYLMVGKDHKESSASLRNAQYQAFAATIGYILSTQ